MDTPNEALIAALRAEREHYLRAGRADRAKAVDAELARLGVPVDKPAAPRKPTARGG